VFEKIKKVDGVIVVILIMLMVVSVSSIYSVTHGGGFDGHHLKMLKYYILGFIAFTGLSFFDYRLLVKKAPYFYVFGLGLLVLVNFTPAKNGAKGWLELPGGLSLQPAELFKLLLILFLAAVLVRKDRAKLFFWRDILPLTLIMLLPFVVVISQNDLGNALSYIVILMGLLWIGNIKFSHALIGLVVIGGSAFAGVTGYIQYHDQAVHFIEDTLGRDHLVDRFDPWLVPDLASRDASYQTRNAMLAIASGGMIGEGYMEGTSVQAKRVPYTYSDAIFVQIAEEFGFLGSAGLLMLFFILIHRMILIALECRDRAGPFLIIGVVAMLLYQILENIGAFIGLMPLTGITLPFISYGGTSLLINMASMGIVMSVHLYGGEAEDELPAHPVYSPPAKLL
jgi:rod shape determining protein RodA